MPKPDSYEIWPVNDPLPFPLSEVTVVNSDEYSAEVTCKVRLPDVIPFEDTDAEVSAGIAHSWKFSIKLLSHRTKDGKINNVISYTGRHVEWFQAHGETGSGDVQGGTFGRYFNNTDNASQARIHLPHHWDSLQAKYDTNPDGSLLITLIGSHHFEYPYNEGNNWKAPKPEYHKQKAGGLEGADSGTPVNPPTSKPENVDSEGANSGAPPKEATFKLEEEGSEGFDFGIAPKPPTSNPTRKFPLLFSGLGCLFILAAIIIVNIWFFDSEFGPDWTDHALVTLHNEGVPIPNDLLPPISINTDTPTPTNSSVEVQPVFNFATDTDTPTLSAKSTDTPVEVQPVTGDISYTPTPTPVKVGGGYTFPIVFTATVTQLSNCRFGDSPYFAYFTGLPVGARVRIYGRNEDGTWEMVGSMENPDVSKMCWTNHNNLSFDGDPTLLKVTTNLTTDIRSSSQLPPAVVTSVKSESGNTMAPNSSGNNPARNGSASTIVRNITIKWTGSVSAPKSTTNDSTPSYIFVFSSCENGQLVQHALGTNDYSIKFQVASCGFRLPPAHLTEQQHSSSSTESYYYADTPVDLSLDLTSAP